MKTVYGTNYDVIDNWIRWNKAEVEFDGRNNNKSLYFEGNMLYSYGKHYPLSKFIKTNKGKFIVLVNNESSSPTTNNHKSKVLRFMDCGKALKVFLIKDFEDMEINVSDYDLRIESKINTLLRSRDPWWIGNRINWIEWSISERNKFIKIFKLDFPKMEFKEFLDDRQMVKLVTMKLRAKI